MQGSCRRLASAMTLEEEVSCEMAFVRQEMKIYKNYVL